MLPNHTLFQIARDLPTTKNELRDSCRAHIPPAIQKYQDDLLSLIKPKLEKKISDKVKVAQEKHNINFAQQAFPKATLAKQTATVKSEKSEGKLVLDPSSKLPSTKIKMAQAQPSSRLFGDHSGLKVSKAVQQGEQRLKALEDTLVPKDPSLAWYEIFNKLTGLDVHVSVVSAVRSERKPEIVE